MLCDARGSYLTPPPLSSSVFKQSYASLNSDFEAAKTELNVLKMEKARGAEADPGVVASSRNSAKMKRDFAPQRTGMEGLPPGSVRSVNPLKR